MKSKRILLCLCLGCAIAVGRAADSTARRMVGSNAVSGLPPKVHNRQVSVVTEINQRGLRLDERSGDGVAWWPDTTFADGTVEFDGRGTNVVQKSFVGVAFHGLDENTYETVYFRPFNFKSTDPARRSHGVQYIAHPAFTWDKLRAERPNEFEKEVSPTTDPDGWFHVRIVVNQSRVRVFVNHEEKPSLEVRRLSDRKSGWIGIWVGNGSGGDFANLTITPAL